MTVQQLIETLQKMDKTAKVYLETLNENGAKEVKQFCYNGETICYIGDDLSEIEEELKENN